MCIRDSCDSDVNCSRLFFIHYLLSQFPPSLTHFLHPSPAKTKAAVRHHKKYFGDTDDGEQPDHNSIGNAAAVQALKMFAGGHGGGDESKSQSQSQFIALAMGEASKLFDQQSSQGKVSGDSSSKESAIAKAGEVALKMYLKNQGGGGGGGGGSSGGLLSLASKFL